MDNELLECARIGNVEKLMHISKLPQETYKQVVECLTRCGHVDIFAKCVSKQHIIDNYYDITDCMCRVAASIGQTTILSFLNNVLVPKGIIAYTDSIWDAFFLYGQLEVMEWWFREVRNFSYGQNADIKESVVQCLIWNGKSDMLIKALERGYRANVDSIHTWKRVNKEDEIKVGMIVHEWKLKGGYKKECVKGDCLICPLLNIWDMWVMESQEFTSSIQWLPREMIEDTTSLLYSCMYYEQYE